MEADWEVEIGGDAPVIDACWSGLIDLRASPERARELPEAAELPQLAEALMRLNSQPSPVSTSKSDVWPVSDANDLDPDELDAPPEEATHAWACYIDLVPRNGSWPSHDREEQTTEGAGGFNPRNNASSIDGALAPAGVDALNSGETPSFLEAVLPDAAIHWAKACCERLQAVPLTHCRADLIVRQAILAPDQTDRTDHGITAYLTACGQSSTAAQAALGRALEAFADTICPNSTVE